MKLVIEIPANIAGLIHSSADEYFLVTLIRQSIDDYVNATPRLTKHINDTPVILMRELIESEMRVEK